MEDLLELRKGFKVKKVQENSFSLENSFRNKKSAYKFSLNLNETGAFICKFLEKGILKTNLVEELCAEYEIDKNNAEITVDKFLMTLTLYGLIKNNSTSDFIFKQYKQLNLLAEILHVNKNILKTPLGDFLFVKDMYRTPTAHLKQFRSNNKDFVIKFFLNTDKVSVLKIKQSYMNLLLNFPTCNCVVPNLYLGCLNNGKSKMYYIIMPLLTQTLMHYKMREKISLDKFEFIFNKLLDAIETLHNHNIIHCDLSPANIFLDNDVILINDFESSVFKGTNNINLIKDYEDTLRMNYHYFSPPEQTNRLVISKINTSVDWYAFGIILYWLITDNLPENNFNAADIIFPKEYSKYQNTIKLLLDKNPDKRPKNRNEILRMLKNT